MRKRVPEDKKKIRLIQPIKCLYCGKEFKPKDSKAKYCSVECYRASNSGSRPSFSELIESFKKYKSFLSVGKFYNVSDSAVRKWCRLYKIPDSTKEMEEFVNNF